MQLHDEPLMSAISTEAIRKIGMFSAQHLSTIAWAFAKLLIWNPTLFSSIAAQAISRIADCDPQCHANLVWAFATLCRVNTPLIYAISSAAMAQMSEWLPQELSNTAWSFARMKVKDPPLLASIASQSMRTLVQFTSLNLSNTAWAFAVLSEDAHLENILPPGVRHFLEVADLSVGTEWVDLVGVVEAQDRRFLGREDLILRFQEGIFQPAMNQLAMIVDPARDRMAALRDFKIFVDMRQLPHLGFRYTGRALSSLGWVVAPGATEWVAKARMEAWASQGLSVGTQVRTEQIVAWMSACLRLRDCAIEVPGRIFHAGIPPHVSDDVRELLWPTFRHTARDDHAERAALLTLLAAARDALPAAGCAGGGSAWLGELSGVVRLYVTHWPCISCTAVLGQFWRLMPGLLLEVAFDDAWAEGA